MSTPSNYKTQNNTNGNSRPAKRRRKDGIFVEYQPGGAQRAAPRPVSSKAEKPESRKSLSCGECRRLKLKCDRVFPCQACIRRGCQGICPNGTLVSGTGTRYVLASTEQLHAKISEMSERIRELELALQVIYEEHRLCSVRYQSELGHDVCQVVPPLTHALLQGDKLLVKNHLELYGEGQEPRIASSPDVFHPEGQRDSEQENISTSENSSQHDVPNQARFGQSNASNLNDEPQRNSDSSTVTTLADDADLVGHHIIQRQSQPLANATPTILSALNSSFLTVSRKIAFGGFDATEIRRIRPNHSRLKFARTEILDMLPPREEAERLCSVAQEVGFYIINSVLSKSDIGNMLDDVCDGRHADVSLIDAALTFIVLGIGLRVDCLASKDTKDAGTATREDVESYVNISRAAVALFVIESAQETLEASELRIIKYHLLFMQFLALLSMHKQDREQTKSAMDILVSLTKRAELRKQYVEASYSKYSKEEQDVRRLLFYEILSAVGDLSLALDQPAPFEFVDTCPPGPGGSASRFPTRLEASYYECKHLFYDACLKPVLDMRSTLPTNVTYTDIMELDCKIRNFAFPPMVLQELDAEPTTTAANVPTTLNVNILGFIATYRTSALLLHLHRRFLQQCLASRNSVLAHPYIASVFATSRSAWVLIQKCDALHQLYPDFVNRLALPWYNVFCATSALFILVERIPYCPMAPYSLRELIRAGDMFDRASGEHSPMAEQAAPIVRQFTEKSIGTVRCWKETLALEFENDSILQNRVDYCTARLDAIIDRIKRAATLETLLPVPLETNKRDDSITTGLEIWDIVHPEVGQVLLELNSSGCTIDGETSDQLLCDIVHAPISDRDGRASGFSSSRTPLTDFFTALDRQLRLGRPQYLSLPNSSAEVPDLQASFDFSTALRDMFPNDLDLDWAALTDALVAAPVELTNAVQDSNWTGQWEWRDSALPLGGTEADTSFSWPWLHTLEES